MTTPLEKTIKRALKIKGRQYVVALSPESVKLTLKGQRNGVELKWIDLINGDAAHRLPSASSRKISSAREPIGNRGEERGDRIATWAITSLRCQPPSRIQEVVACSSSLPAPCGSRQASHIAVRPRASSVLATAVGSNRGAALLNLSMSN